MHKILQNQNYYSEREAIQFGIMQYVGQLLQVSLQYDMYPVVKMSQIQQQKFYMGQEECMSEQNLISGQNWPDDQPGHRLRLS